VNALSIALRRAAIRGPRDARPVVLHVGEAGAVPCGIAQVLNEYLDWTFESLRVQVTASTRGRRGDPRAPGLTLLSALRILGRRLSRRPHAVVVHLSNGGSFIREGGLAALARACGFPVAVQLHGSVFKQFAAAHPRLVRSVLGLADVVYVLTAETEDVVRGLAGPGARVVKVGNGVVVPAEGPAKEPVVLFGGEVGMRKGVDVLLAAWERVRAGHPGWRLVIAGPVEPEIGALPLPPATTLLGAVSRAELQDRQARAAVAVLPSRDEALPMFLLEAMARGCAVVGTPVGDVPELLEGCGRLVPVGDTAALAAALDELMADPATVAALGDAGRERVTRRYSSAVLAARFEREWSALLESARRTRPGRRSTAPGAG
jgi:glycosyltransferase involved in cell wall biosynthesis